LQTLELKLFTKIALSDIYAVPWPDIEMHQVF